MVTKIFDQTPFEMGFFLKLARYGMVEVTVDEEQKPGEDLFLIFLAPRTMLERFLKTLRAQGIKFTQEVNKEESMIRCLLISRDSKL